MKLCSFCFPVTESEDVYWRFFCQVDDGKQYVSTLSAVNRKYLLTKWTIILLKWATIVAIYIISLVFISKAERKKMTDSGVQINREEDLQ
jgi:hypothetical protein